MKFLKCLLPAFLLISMAACSQKQTKSIQEPKPAVTESAPANLSAYSVATFASGCFWCVEAAFESVKGVKEVVSGYSGGTETNPTYEEVGSGRTGHAEAIKVYYDPKEINFETLLEVYFSSQDPTQVNGQGPDRGSQYRSIIFYNNDAEKKQAENFKARLQASGKYTSPIAAQIVPFQKFWQAEEYHQNYVKINPNQSYVVGESIPRIKAFQAKHPELIKEGARF